MATKKRGGKGRRRPPSKPAARSSAKPAPKPSTVAPAASPGKTQGAPPSGAQPAKTATAGKSQGASASTSKAGRTGPTRAARIEAAQRARRRKAILTRVAIVGIVLAVATGISFVMVSNRQSSAETQKKLEAGSCEFDRKADSDDGAGRNHVASPTYEVNPPSGGNHLANPAPAGVFTAENLPPDGQLVHSLEHGYVIIWYRPDIGEQALNDLRSVVDKYSRDVLLVPRPSLPVPVAATAWERRLLCQGPEPQALETFVTSFRNEGPEKVPH